MYPRCQLSAANVWRCVVAKEEAGVYLLTISGRKFGISVATHISEMNMFMRFALCLGRTYPEQLQIIITYSSILFLLTGPCSCRVRINIWEPTPAD